ncbi:MAG: universal stress protein [Proteobacteria bacterium]|nr:universal stress protein [Pseudomonadota bacterium]
MFRRVLVVIENERIYQPAIEYVLELSLRMDSEVTFLVVVEMAFLDNTWLGSKRNAISELEDRAGPLLADLSTRFLKEGVSTSSAIRMGDPGQEFLKFLAERQPFQAIIWGSGEDLPRAVRRGHWLSRASASLECPVLTVSSRHQGGKSKPVDREDYH